MKVPDNTVPKTSFLKKKKTAHPRYKFFTFYYCFSLSEPEQGLGFGGYH